MKGGIKEKTEWVEVKPAEQEQEESPERFVNEAVFYDTNLYIEYGALRMTAGREYPVESLVMLMREVCAAC